MFIRRTDRIRMIEAHGGTQPKALAASAATVTSGLSCYEPSPGSTSFHDTIWIVARFNTHIVPRASFGP